MQRDNDGRFVASPIDKHVVTREGREAGFPWLGRLRNAEKKHGLGLASTLRYLVTYLEGPTSAHARLY